MLFGTNTDYGKKMNMYEQTLDAVRLRRDVIADNIANADTPFFKRSEVTFESQLRRAIDSEKEPQFPAMMTDPRHMAFDEVIDYQGVRPNVAVEFDTSFRNDKNNVDIDKEMVDANKNALQFNALMEVYSRNLKVIDLVLR